MNNFHVTLHRLHNMLSGGNPTDGNSVKRFLTPYQHSRLPLSSSKSNSNHFINTSRCTPWLSTDLPQDSVITKSEVQNLMDTSEVEPWEAYWKLQNIHVPSFVLTPFWSRTWNGETIEGSRMVGCLDGGALSEAVPSVLWLGLQEVHLRCTTVWSGAFALSRSLFRM